MKLLAALLFAFASIAQADTITLLPNGGSVRGAGGTQDYYSVPNDAGAQIDIVNNSTQAYVTYSIDGVTCRGFTYEPQVCSDGTFAMISQYQVRMQSGKAPRINRWWELRGGSISTNVQP
jgi:hypothetical protein